MWESCQRHGLRQRCFWKLGFPLTGLLWFCINVAGKVTINKPMAFFLLQLMKWREGSSWTFSPRARGDSEHSAPLRRSQNGHQEKDTLRGEKVKMCNWNIFVNPFMPVVPKTFDNFGDIIFTRGIFTNYLRDNWWSKPYQQFDFKFVNFPWLLKTFSLRHLGMSGLISSDNCGGLILSYSQRLASSCWCWKRRVKWIKLL